MSTITPRDQLNALEKQRKHLEIEIQDLLQDIPQEFRNTLKRPKYTDGEGFPRADIDIWHIAEIRKKIVMLQNDHVDSMKQIEQLLITVFSSTNNNNFDDKKTETVQHNNIKHQTIDKNDIISNMKAFISNANDTQHQKEEKEKTEDLNALEPFYLIDKIFDNSPSHSAGLKCGDLIIKFGSMTKTNQSAKLMQDIVKQSINKAIPVIIKRNPEGFRTLQLVPRKWNGRGLLGCHLTPYPN